MNFQKKKTIVISDNKFQNSISKIQIQFKNSRKNLSQDSNFDIIKSNLSKEESKNKNRKKSKNSILYNNNTKSSYNDTKKSEISIEEIEKKLIERYSQKDISIRNKPKSPKNISLNIKNEDNNNNIVITDNSKVQKRWKKRKKEM